MLFRFLLKLMLGIISLSGFNFFYCMDNLSDSTVALVEAISIGDIEAAQVLIEDYEADVNATNYLKITPLMVAVGLSNEQAVKLLLEKGAYVGAQDFNNKTALDYAVKRNNGEIKGLLFLCLKRLNIVKKIQLDSIFPDLLSVTRNNKVNNINIIRYLVDKEKDINKVDQNGRSALMWASLNGDLETVKYLISHGADIKAVDNKGNNLLSHLLLGSQTYLQMLDYKIRSLYQIFNYFIKYGVIMIDEFTAEYFDSSIRYRNIYFVKEKEYIDDQKKLVLADFCNKYFKVLDWDLLTMACAYQWEDVLEYLLENKDFQKLLLVDNNKLKELLRTIISLNWHVTYKVFSKYGYYNKFDYSAIFIPHTIKNLIAKSKVAKGLHNAQKNNYFSDISFL